MSRDSFKLPDNERGSIQYYPESIGFNRESVSHDNLDVKNNTAFEVDTSRLSTNTTNTTSTIGSTGTRQTTLAKGFPANLNEDNIEEEYFKTDAAKELVGQGGTLPAQSEQEHKKRKVNEKEKKKAYKLLGNLIEAIQTAENNQKKYSRFSPMRMVYFIRIKVNEARLQRLARKKNIPTEIVERLKATANRTELEAPAPPPRVSQQQLAREEDTESIAEIKKMGKLYVEDSFAYTAYEGKSVADTIADRVKRGQLKLEGEVYDGVAGENKAENIKVKRKKKKKKKKKRSKVKVEKTQRDELDDILDGKITKPKTEDWAPQEFKDLGITMTDGNKLPNSEFTAKNPNYKSSQSVVKAPLFNPVVSSAQKEHSLDNFAKPMNEDIAAPITIRPKSMKQKTREKSGDRRKSLG